MSAAGTSGDGSSGEFVTNAAESRTFPWSDAKRTLSQAFKDAFPGGNFSWKDLSFNECQRNQIWTEEAVISWVEKELLGGPDPFEKHGGAVPVPWPPSEKDQLEDGKYAGYSRRQVCYMTAKTLIGAGTTGYDNGFLRLAETPIGGNKTKVGRRGDFGRSWWFLLAACAADPLLESGAQGPLLLAVKATAAPDVTTVREAAKDASLSTAGLRVCRYNDGDGKGDASELPGVEPVPQQGCTHPKEDGPGVDFMTGGLEGQATQDISAAWLGGYVLGNADGIGGGQDERLMVYFPEVAALAFFLSSDPEFPQLRQPAWILGARKVANGIDGSCRWNLPIQWDPATRLNSDVRAVPLGKNAYMMSTSRPFLAFMSENQDFIPSCKECAADERLPAARQNKEPYQRVVDPASDFSFEKQVRAWYRSVALSSYDKDVHPLLRSLVNSVGTGPWLAGLWFGDSQLGLLATWLGHAAAASTWGGGLLLDYYMYADFTENPGNQCFVHSRDNCRACLEECKGNPLPKDAYWLPGGAWMATENESEWNSCAMGPDACGRKGLEDVIAAYRNATAAQLWDALEDVLTQSKEDASDTVFDLLLKNQSPELLDV